MKALLQRHKKEAGWLLILYSFFIAFWSWGGVETSMTISYNPGGLFEVVFVVLLLVFFGKDKIKKFSFKGKFMGWVSNFFSLGTCTENDLNKKFDVVLIEKNFLVQRNDFLCGEVKARDESLKIREEILQDLKNSISYKNLLLEENEKKVSELKESVRLLTDSLVEKNIILEKNKRMLAESASKAANVHRDLEIASREKEIASREKDRLRRCILEYVEEMFSGARKR